MWKALKIILLTIMVSSNGIDVQACLTALQNRVTWQALGGGASDSLRYFEDFDQLNDINVLLALNNGGPYTSKTDPNFTAFIANLQRSVILEGLNSIFNKPQLVDRTKLAFWRDNLPIGQLQYVHNTSQFVGMQIFVGQGDWAVQLHNLMLFFNKTITFNLYLYNDFFLEPVNVFPVTTSANIQNITALVGDTQTIINNSAASYKGGRWYLGYYQDDIMAADVNAQAVYYNINYNTFKPCNIIAFSAPLIANPNDGSRNFQRNNIGANNLMYGMNLEVSTFRDETNNVVNNTGLWDELIGLNMAAKTYEMIVKSDRTGGTQLALQSNPIVSEVYRQLNYKDPDTDTAYSNLLGKKIARAQREVKQAFQKQTELFIS